MEKQPVDCDTAFMQKDNKAAKEKRGCGVAREYAREALHSENWTRPRERIGQCA